MWPDKRSVQWDDHNSISASNSPADAAQDLICLCCCSSTLLTHIQLVAHQGPPGSLAASLLTSHTNHSLYWAPWLFRSRCRTLHLSVGLILGVTFFALGLSFSLSLFLGWFAVSQSSCPPNQQRMQWHSSTSNTFVNSPVLFLSGQKKPPAMAFLAADISFENQR